MSPSDDVSFKSYLEAWQYLKIHPWLRVLGDKKQATCIEITMRCRGE